MIAQQNNRISTLKSMKKLLILVMFVCISTLSFAQTKSSAKKATPKPSIEVVLNQQVEILNARIDSMTIAHQEAIEIVKNEQKEQYANYYNQLDSNNSMAWVILSLIWGAISIVFGIVIPLIINNKSEERVNANVKDLKDQVKSDTDDLKQRLYISLQNNAKAQNTRNDNFKKQLSQIIQKETNLLNSRIEEQKRYVDNIKEDVENYEKSTKINQLLSEAQNTTKDHVEDAIKLYSQVLNLDPNNESAFLWRGIAFMLAGKSADALSDLNRTLELNPNQAKAYNNIGNVYKKENLTEDAIANYKQALKIDPQYISAYLNLSLICLEINSPEALQYIDAALRIDANNPDAHMLKSMYYDIKARQETNPALQNEYENKRDEEHNISRHLRLMQRR